MTSSMNAPPPIAAFFLGRVIVWVLLVSGCALPLMLMTWPHFTPSERLAEGLGVVIWIVVIVVVAEQLRLALTDVWPVGRALQQMMWSRWNDREADRRSRTLRSGALALMTVHAGLAVFAGELGLFLWFAPAVWSQSWLARLVDSDCGFAPVLSMTLLCGAQTALLASLSGRAIDGVRRGFGSR